MKSDRPPELFRAPASPSPCLQPGTVHRGLGRVKAGDSAARRWPEIIPRSIDPGSIASARLNTCIRTTSNLAIDEVPVANHAYKLHKCELEPAYGVASLRSSFIYMMTE